MVFVVISVFLLAIIAVLLAYLLRTGPTEDELRRRQEKPPEDDEP